MNHPARIEATLPQDRRQPHPNSAKVRAVLKRCALDAGASLSELRGRGLRVRLHPARQMAARILVHDFGMSHAKAGEALKRDRTTVRELLRLPE